MVHPLLVFEVPAHGFFDALLELQRGFPAQLVFQFARIDGIPQVVPRTVGDVGDELLALAFGVAQQPIDGADDDFNQVDVLPFVESADIVGFGDAAFVEDQVDGAGVVFDVEPVADVLAAAVDGQRTAFPYVVDEERNQLLGKLVGPVVVRAVGHQRRHAVGVVESTDEVVAAGFGSGVGTVRVIFRGFQEESLAVCQVMFRR